MNGTDPRIIFGLQEHDVVRPVDIKRINIGRTHVSASGNNARIDT
jgi:hypothetical protein